MSTSDRPAMPQDVAVARMGTEIAYQAGVGAAALEEAVRKIDQCLFLLAADRELSSGRRSAFAPDAVGEMAGDLERAALQMGAVSTRLSVLGGHSLRIADAAATAP